MTELEKQAAQIVLLQQQVRVLAERVEHPPRLPEYFVVMANGIREVERVAVEISVLPEAAWRPGPRRVEIMRALRARGWSKSRVAKVLGVSETAVTKGTREKVGR